MTSRRLGPRALACAALALVVAASAYLLLHDPGGYVIHARFLDAEGLVKGGRVQVAGRKVGSIADISATRDGLAQVDLKIEDDDVVPLHTGTRADIRAVGQAGLANRFVELSPGPDRRLPLRSGAVLPTTQTSGIVNLDALLDSFGPSARRNLRQLIERSSEVYAGSGARSFNTMLGRLAPATGQVAGVAQELEGDRVALGELISTAQRTSTALASRHDDLASAVRNGSEALGALARERGALGATLNRAPTALKRATGTFARTRTAVTTLRPALRDLTRAVTPARTFLNGTSALLDHSEPTLAALRLDLPALNETLFEAPPLAKPLVPALRATGAAMGDMRHIFRGLRLYGSDLILGVVSGLVGVTTGPYDARGHYGKLNFIQSPQTGTSGALAELLQQHPVLPDLLSTRTKITRRCPGALAPPAPDGSSPWSLGEALCSDDDGIPPSVNQP